MENKPFDNTIFDWIKEYGNFEVYDLLDGRKEARDLEKSRFLADPDSKSNPNLDYPDIDPEKLHEAEKNLVAFRDLLRGDTVVYEESLDPGLKERVKQYDEATRTAYIAKINEKIAGIRLLRHTYVLVHTNDPDQIRISSRKIKRYNEFIFGKPSPQVFRMDLLAISNLLSDAEKSGDLEEESLASEIRGLMGNPQSASHMKLTPPDQNTFKTAKDSTEQEFSKLININFPQGEYSADEIKDLFTIALKEIKADGWNILIDSDSSRTAIHVDQSNKTVVIPEEKKLEARKVKALILHEIGTHVARRVNGERSKLILLGIGLDRYKDDEGIATMREQILKDDFDDFSGFESHFAIGLAYGLDGTSPRDFRQTYEILYRIFKLQSLRKNKRGKEAEDRAKERAWNRCIRTFRGTNCSVPGVCFTKDIFYRESNIDVWRIWGNNPVAATTFNIGKYDPANPRHLTVLVQLDILERDLVQIESLQEA